MMETLSKILTTLIILIIITMVFCLIIVPKPIEYYYITADDKYGLKVAASIDYCEDPKISLNGVTFQQAIQICDSLNLTLKNR